MEAIKILHADEAIDLHELKGDRCLVELGDQKVVLTYDTAFELALRLSAFLRDVEEHEEPDEVDYSERLN